MKLSQGEFERAKAKYEAALAKDPMNFAARNDLGLLFWNAGKRKDAFELFLDAVKRHPDNATAHANLGFMFLSAGSLQEAKMLYEAALRLDPSHAEAKRGLAAVLTQLGTSASELRDATGKIDSVTVIPYRGNGKPVSVLLLVSLGSGNVHIEQLLSDRIFEVTKLAVEVFDPGAALPKHDLIFNAIGDAESCAEALLAANQLLGAETNVLNHPERVLATTRSSNSRRLGELEGVRTARTRLLPRKSLTGGDALVQLQQSGLDFPVLLRSPGHHTGHHFLRVETESELTAAARQLPGEQLYAMEFLDVRSGDGKVRKFRVMFVDGELYPLHLAVSSDWKVHYFSAQMADFPEHRAEDEAFLSDMTSVLGSDAVAALHRIERTVGLDYAGIDFALGPGGEIDVFECNATMVIVQPGHEEQWAYRQLPVRRVTTAVEKLVRSRA